MNNQSSNKLTNIINYFQKFESKLGYNLVLGGAKHFGYYPSGKKDIKEKKAQELMQNLLAQKLKLTKDDKILDAGCGQGNVAVYLARKYSCHVTGITIIPFEVKKAQKLAHKFKVDDKTSFFEMNYAKTTFPDNHFDAIFTMESLVHAYDLQKTLREFKRILKPTGRIAFFEYSIAPEEKMGNYLKHCYPLQQKHFKALTDWVIEKSGMFSLKTLRHGRLPVILQEIGFQNIQEENTSSKIKPSMLRLYRISKIPYWFIKLFHLQDTFVNATTAAEFFPYMLQNNDLFRYNITTAEKKP